MKSHGKSRSPASNPSRQRITRARARSYPGSPTGTSTDRALTIAGADSSVTFPLPTWMFEAVVYVPLGTTMQVGEPAFSAMTFHGQHALQGTHQSGSSNKLVPMTNLTSTIRQRTPTGKQQHLEEVEEDVPIAAWKVATLGVNDDRTAFALRAPQQHIPYEMHMEGRCSLGQHHLVPDLQCKCGFYAYRTVKDLYKYNIIQNYGDRERGQVLLSVDLSGIVIEHERLFRAQYQTILGVWLPSECVNIACHSPAEHIVVTNGFPRGLCDPCIDDFQAKKPFITYHVFSCADITNMLGIEARFFAGTAW